MSRILYLHPHNHPFAEVIPVGAIGALNALPGEKLGRYAFEVTAEEIDVARVVLLDVHWSFPVAVLRETIAELRAINPEIAVVVGGLTAAFYGRLFLERYGPDHVVTGDVEASLPPLIQHLLAGEEPPPLPGVIGARGSGPPPPRLDARAFDAIDWLTLDWFPTYDALARARHRASVGAGLEDNIHPILPVTRGCVRDCLFCIGGFQERVFGRRTLVRSAEALVRDLRRIEANPDLRFVSIFLSDSSFLSLYTDALAHERFELDGFLFLCGDADPDEARVLREAFAGEVIFSLVQPEDLSPLRSRDTGADGFEALVDRLAGLRRTRCMVYHVDRPPRPALGRLAASNEAVRQQSAEDWQITRPLDREEPEEAWLADSLEEVHQAARGVATYHLVRALWPELARRALPLPLDLGHLEAHHEEMVAASEASPAILAALGELVEHLRARRVYGFDSLELELWSIGGEPGGAPGGDWAHPGEKVGEARWWPTLRGFALSGEYRGLVEGAGVALVPRPGLGGRPWLDDASLTGLRVPALFPAPASEGTLGCRIEAGAVSIFFGEHPPADLAPLPPLTSGRRSPESEGARGAGTGTVTVEDILGEQPGPGFDDLERVRGSLEALPAQLLPAGGEPLALRLLELKTGHALLELRGPDAPPAVVALLPRAPWPRLLAAGAFALAYRSADEALLDAGAREALLRLLGELSGRARGQRGRGRGPPLDPIHQKHDPEGGGASSPDAAVARQLPCLAGQAPLRSRSR